MSGDLEYAIRKDVRNNPVIREHDARQRREFRTIVLLACGAVAVLLVAAWQHFETLQHRMAIEDLKLSRAYEQTTNRRLRLNLETLSTPQQIEQRARALGLVPATADRTLIVERVRAASPSRSIVAQAR
jgi:cell division protein FtsL